MARRCGERRILESGRDAVVFVLSGLCGPLFYVAKDVKNWKQNPDKEAA